MQTLCCDSIDFGVGRNIFDTDFSIYESFLTFSLYIEKKARAAFTLLEIVFVLIIVSVLSVIAIGSYERDELGEATM